ncbi:MAG TPA: hypothetical protein VGC82_05545 [Rhodopila sp.]
MAAVPADRLALPPIAVLFEDRADRDPGRLDKVRGVTRAAAMPAIATVRSRATMVRAPRVSKRRTVGPDARTLILAPRAPGTSHARRVRIMRRGLRGKISSHL